MSHEPSDNPTTFSFVCTIADAPRSVERFHAELLRAARELGEPFEVVYVNDGAADEPSGVLRRLAGEQRVRLVELSRRFGPDAAADAGADHACGRAIVFIRGEQPPSPDLLRELAARWREGFEIVTAGRREENASAGCRLLDRLDGRGPAERADVRLLDRRVAEAMHQARLHGSDARGLLGWIGFRRTSVASGSRGADRPAGACARWQTVARPVIGPLWSAAPAGAALAVLAGVWLIVSLALWPFGLAPGAVWALAALVVAVIGGQLLLASLGGFCLVRAVHQARRRPLYVVRRTHGFPEPADETADAVAESESSDLPRERFSVFT